MSSEHTLVSAATAGDLDACERVLAVPLTGTCSMTCFGRAALVRAARAGHKEVVELLLRHGAHAYDGMIPAAAAGHTEIVRVLMDRGAHVDTREPFGDSALTAAARWGRVGVVELLLERGPYTEDMKVALRSAAGGGHLDVVQVLLKAGVAPSTTALADAAEGGHLGVVDQLLKAGAKPSSEALICAAEGGHLGAAELLLKAGAKPWLPALRAAAEQGHTGLLELLLDRADPYDKDDAMAAAAGSGHLGTVEMLLRHGVDPNLGMGSAAREGHRDVVERLLAAGADAMLYFCGKASPFSNHHPCRFQIDGVVYSCVEQYMLAEKARAFGDDDALAAILREGDPGKLKRLGRRVRNYDGDRWTMLRCGIVLRGVLAKFRSNPQLLATLLATGNMVLAQASPRDRVWGIGLDAARADKGDKWRGRNLLGEILMDARKMLRAEPLAEE